MIGQYLGAVACVASLVWTFLVARDTRPIIDCTGKRPKVIRGTHEHVIARRPYRRVGR